MSFLKETTKTQHSDVSWEFGERCYFLFEVKFVVYVKF